MNLAGEVAKKRFKTLRDSYVRRRRESKTKSGQAAKKAKKWKFDGLLEFLEPHIYDNL